MSHRNNHWYRTVQRALGPMEGAEQAAANREAALYETLMGDGFTRADEKITAARRAAEAANPLVILAGAKTPEERAAAVQAYNQAGPIDQAAIAVKAGVIDPLYDVWMGAGKQIGKGATPWGRELQAKAIRRSAAIEARNKEAKSLQAGTIEGLGKGTQTTQPQAARPAPMKVRTTTVSRRKGPPVLESFEQSILRERDTVQKARQDLHTLKVEQGLLGADLAKTGADKRAKLRTAREAEYEKLTANFRAKLGHINARYKKLSEKEIDPQRIWKQASAGQKAAGLIAIALGGLAEGLSMGRVKNVALQMINKAVNDDIEAQKINAQRQLQGLAHEETLLGKLYMLDKGNLQRAEGAAKEALADHLMVETKLLAAEGGEREAKAYMVLAAAKDKLDYLRERYGRERTAIGSKAITSTTRTVTGGPKTGGRGGRISLAELRDQRNKLAGAVAGRQKVVNYVRKWLGVSELSKKTAWALPESVVQITHGADAATLGEGSRLVLDAINEVSGAAMTAKEQNIGRMNQALYQGRYAGLQAIINQLERANAKVEGYVKHGHPAFSARWADEHAENQKTIRLLKQLQKKYK